MIKNLFTIDTHHDLTNEIFEDLCQGKKFRCERVVSSGQVTPEGQWLCQSENEWVILLAGSAKLGFENSNESYSLFPGDYFFIPANTKHRVAWTDPKVKTVWLAIHFTT